MLCRICWKDSACPLQTFEINGVEADVDTILQKHLKFLAHSNDSKTTKNICRVCWFKVSDFHQFFVAVEEAQNKNNPYDQCACAELPGSLKFKIKEEFGLEASCHPLFEPVLLESSFDTESEANKIFNDVIIEPAFSVSPNITTANEDINVTISPQTLPQRLKQYKVSKTFLTQRKRCQRLSSCDAAMIKKHIPMGCDLCTFVGEDFTEMTKHFRLKHNPLKAYIKCCGRKFNKRVLVVQHAYKHENPEFFKCEECRKVFSDGSVLRSHIISAHAPEDELRYSCDQCTRRFSRRSLLDLHKPSHIPMNERKFFCDKCLDPKPFASDHLLQIHINMRHTRATNVCHVCAKEIRDKVAYEKHVRLHFEDSGPRLKCPRPDCDRWLKDVDNLKQHMRRHDDAGKTYICDDCGRECKNRRSLASHFSYAHSRAVFACDECHKTFKKAITLKEHKAGQHSGESLYKCPFCARAFNSNANMHSHKKKMHPVEWDVWRKTKRGSSQQDWSNRLVMEAVAKSINNDDKNNYNGNNFSCNTKVLMDAERVK